MAYRHPFRRWRGPCPLSLIANRTPPDLYQSRMETERARECFRLLDSCRDADSSDRIDRSGLALVLAWIPYQDERLHTGKRESGSKTATLVFADNCPQPFLYRAQLD